MTGPELSSFIINAISGNIQERKNTITNPEKRMSNVLFKAALKILFRGTVLIL